MKVNNVSYLYTTAVIQSYYTTITCVSIPSHKLYTRKCTLHIIYPSTCKSIRCGSTSLYTAYSEIFIDIFRKIKTSLQPSPNKKLKCHCSYNIFKANCTL